MRIVSTVQLPLENTSYHKNKKPRESFRSQGLLLRKLKSPYDHARKSSSPRRASESRNDRRERCIPAAIKSANRSIVNSSGTGAWFHLGQKSRAVIGPNRGQKAPTQLKDPKFYALRRNLIDDSAFW
jgi:hypothetical protein